MLFGSGSRFASGFDMEFVKWGENCALVSPDKVAAMTDKAMRILLRFFI